eukprot:TRINITY_DN23635_c0_g1_i1.p1 TRINITY_DN23635_c0_g1~~TRINITY_DN23635_c0_g1_i1.p1  ORF type:complete len:150 (+),score=35.40 TRINITY_DN23635_c0_g1_i1:68-451(+)
MWELAGEAETLGEDIVALQDHLVALDKERQDSRVGWRSLSKKPAGDSWVLTEVGLFVKKRNRTVIEDLKKNQERLDVAVEESREEVKDKMRRLAELEHNTELKKWAESFNLRPLSAKEAVFNPNAES